MVSSWIPDGGQDIILERSSSPVSAGSARFEYMVTLQPALATTAEAKARAPMARDLAKYIFPCGGGCFLFLLRGGFVAFVSPFRIGCRVLTDGSNDDGGREQQVYSMQYLTFICWPETSKVPSTLVRGFDSLFQALSIHHYGNARRIQ